MSTTLAPSTFPMSPVAAALMTKPRFFKPFLIASIKQTMKEQHVSGAELARRTGYPYTTLQRKLAGKSKLYVPDVLHFADALDTLAAEWFENMEAAAEWIIDSLGSAAGLQAVDALANGLEVDPYELLKATMDARTAGTVNLLQPALVRVITRRLRELGMTKAALASAVGMHPTSLSARLNGRQPLDTAEIDRIAAALGIGTAFDLINLAANDAEQVTR